MMIHASLLGRFAPLAYFKAVSWLDQTSPTTLDIKNHYTKNTGQPKTSTGHVKTLGGKTDHYGTNNAEKTTNH